MRASQCVGCREFPCPDVRHESYLVPDVDLQPSRIRMAMVSETAPHDPGDYYYAARSSLAWP